MQADVPQWLIQAYVRSVQSAGSPLSKEELAEACRRLIDTWSSPDRAYHGLSHVIDLLTRLETLLPETHEPSLVRLAAWYHGIAFSTSEEDAYMRKGGENVPSSATAAEYSLKDLGVDPEKAARVAALIRGLKRADLKSANETSQFHAVDVDELALRDAHLGTLAVDPQRYKKYLELIGKEYSHIPIDDFLLARQKIVSSILKRRQLFVTPLAKPWDAQARENLEAELERINLILAKRAQAGQDPEERNKPAKSAMNSLLQASAQADAEEAEATARAAARAPRVPEFDLYAPKASDILSSMESCVDKADPGIRPIEPVTAEQKKQRRREEIAAEMRRRIAERNKAADDVRLAREKHLPSSGMPAAPSASPSGVAAPSPSTPSSSAPSAPSPSDTYYYSAPSAASARTAPSAATPEHPDIPSHGIEREPKI